jgi:hypothetical protein
VEGAREALIEGSAPLEFALPTPSQGGPDGPLPRLNYADSAGRERLGLALVAGEEYQYGPGSHWSSEAGAIASGRKAMISFRLDARLYARLGDPAPSYDREDLDLQDKQTSASVSYASYARYRGDISMRTEAGTVSIRRDAAQWGPALFNNLAFQQNAIPFDQLTYQAALGPVKVTSLYGELGIGPSQSFSRESLEGRHLYAHRYELSLGRNWLLGASEQLFLYKENRPILFVPVFPLFIAKGTMLEEANNGNLAIDICYRAPGLGLFYSEFLLDDLESPSSLFLRNYSQNKWGWVVGSHLAFPNRFGTAGLIAEYARLEPWVYTHFDPGTAQAAHLGYPLGNPYGPNSMNATVKVYLRLGSEVYLGLGQALLWKGKGPGSSIDDPAPRDAFTPKEFLSGAGDPDYSLSPEAYWTRGGLSFGFSGEFGPKAVFWAGTRYFY